MSLSQKHSGKVFVPWFNTAEWRRVYDIICSENEENYIQALYVLKIWKYRTPLLSAGVEGTLILLEALLVEKDGLSDERLCQIQSLALMRFLNLCAANSERQGSFHKTMAKNKLPKWLIGIRHDIAHSHKLPSRAVLELSIRKCLDWVKQKYWEIQKEIIFDYVASDNSDLKAILNIYAELKLNIFFQNDCDESLIEKVTRLMGKRFHKNKFDIQTAVKVLEENLKQSFTDPNYTTLAEKVSKVLVSKDVLLNVQTESDSEGSEVIIRSFRDLWCPLLNTLFENGLLFAVLNEFLDVTNNDTVDECIRNFASLWIKEIFQGLQKIRLVKEEIDTIAMDNADQLDTKTSTIVLKSVIEKRFPEYKDCLEFYSPHCLTFPSAEVFQERILNFPNNYTLNFLESVLKFNKNSDDFISDTVTLVKKLIGSTVNIVDDEVYTPENLGEIFWDEPDNMDIEREASENAPTVNPETAQNEGLTRKWNLITDTSSYQGCPLGILPHQNRNKNPVLNI